MINLTYRRPANAVPTRSGAANFPHLFLNQTFKTKYADRAPLPFDRDRFLERASRRMLCYFSEEELSQVRAHYAFLIERVKKKIKRCFFGKQKWRKTLFQNFSASQLQTPMEKIWTLKKRNILLDTYVFIFEECINYSIVFLALREFLSESGMIDEFKMYLTDPVTLMLYSVMEFAKVQEQFSVR